jgi:drug/metabolite transporter (DMT)-like permease
MNTVSIWNYSKLFFAVCAWGVSFIATKIALQELSPMTVVWLRFGIGVMVLAIVTLIRKEFRTVTPRDIGYFALLGFIGITFHQWLQVTGLVTAAAISTAWIITTTPIFIALLGWIFLREKLTVLQSFGIVAATAGVILILGKDDLSAMWRKGIGSYGDLLVFLSAANWAVFSVLSRKGLTGFPATFMILCIMLSGWMFTSVILINGGLFSEIPSLSINGWFVIAFLGIFCSGFAYIFWYDALKVLPVSSVGSFLYFEPVATVLVAIPLLGEQIYPTTIAGGLCIVFGVWLVNRKYF